MALQGVSLKIRYIGVVWSLVYDEAIYFDIHFYVLSICITIQMKHTLVRVSLLSHLQLE
jgi:hypothetical protein